MATRFTLRHRLPISVDAYWERLFFDPDYNRALSLEGLSFERYEPGEVVVHPDGARSRSLVGEPRSEMPAAIKKLAGSMAYTEEGRYTPSDRTYRFTIVPAKLADKVRITGAIRAEPRGDAELERFVDVEVTASIFGIGGVLEGFVEKTNRTEWEKNAEFTRKYLRENPRFGRGDQR